LSRRRAQQFDVLGAIPLLMMGAVVVDVHDARDGPPQITAVELVQKVGKRDLAFTLD
jgi:hypothetical protein